MLNIQKAHEVSKSILEDIVPSEVERANVNHVINFAKKALESEMASQKIDADVFLGGSMGKNTWLKGDHDIDLFVRFDKKYSEEDICSMLGKLVKSVFPSAEVLHGSRDYYNVRHKGYDLEFVPVYRISNPKDAKNSMDASPFHVDFIRNHSRINNLCDEIRLIKAFAKASDVYGAESYLSGFSGYVTELLGVYAGGFVPLLEVFESVQPKLIIDIEKHYAKPDTIFKVLPEAKLRSPIILIDPVLSSRNAAASLDYPSFSTMILQARLFLRKPSTDFFRKKKVSVASLRKISHKRGTLFVSHRVEKTKEKEDIFLSKLRSIVERINSKIEQDGISVYSYRIVEDKGVNICFEIETCSLSSTSKHYGPPVWIPSDNFDSFMEKNKGAYLEKTSLVVDKKREFTDIAPHVLKVIKEGVKDV